MLKAIRASLAITISVRSVAFSIATMNTVTEKYDDVTKRLREINTLEGISGLLGWDEMVMLPTGSSGCRGEQKEVLAGVLFDKKSDPQLGTLLKDLLKSTDGLSDVQKANVRIANTEYERLVRLPKDHVQYCAKLETDAYNAWIEARRDSDFSKFSPFLKKWVEAKKKEASLISQDGKAYDTLLYSFEKGMTSERLDEIFEEVKAGLVPLIAKIKNGIPPNRSCLDGTYDVDIQAKMCKEIALDLGFDITKGRLDVSVHPFTGGAHPTDVRMTTRFKVDDLTEGLTGAIHETGHSLYEQGRPLTDEYRDLPVSAALSMGVHESQSLLWERMVALSKPFQSYLLPKLKAAFQSHENIQKMSTDELYKAINFVKEPSKIRVESDEVTYTMHVILRYEIEKGLIDGSISIDDIPTIWNNGMAKYLGESSRPTNDAEGCLQDVHWAGGAFAYFPTYSLGAMYACQIYQKAKEELGASMEESIAKGDFVQLKKWLNEKIHACGSYHPNGDELMKAVTGKPLDPQCFLKYLTGKYTEIYGIQ